MTLTMYGWGEFEREARQFIENFDARKARQLKRLGRIFQAEIKKKITETGAVDTGRLRASFTVEQRDSDSVFVGTNVEYAKFVNDGHWTNPQGVQWRFVPGRWRANGTFEYIPYPLNEGQGMWLRQQFVRGKKFLEKAIYSAKPKLVEDLERFMEDLRREWEGQ